MENCKVEFICDSGQKIIFDFSLEDDGSLEYKPSFEPKLTDPTINLGLGGQLCQTFITALYENSKVEDQQIKDGKSKRKLES